ncbi:MAG TPA: hypothetical protein VIL46_13460 [Gemmataceae bacterium]
MKRAWFGIVLAGLLTQAGCMGLDRLNPFGGPRPGEIPEPITPPGSLDIVDDPGTPQARHSDIEADAVLRGLHPVSDGGVVTADEINAQNAVQQLEAFRAELTRDMHRGHAAAEVGRESAAARPE